MKNIKIGNILIYITLLITLSLWLFAKNSITEIVNDSLISLNQIAALLGTILFSWSMFLATRLDFLERFFGGLDKVYRAHRWVSEIGAILIFTHLIALMVGIPQKGLSYLLPMHNIGPINLGVYSFWIFVFLILITLLIKKIKLPYHIWKYTHKFLNMAMILALLHVAMINSDTSSFAPLGVWMNTITGLGVASGLYMTFFYKHVSSKYKYEIIKIDRYQDIHDVYLKPITKKLIHNIAQYAYVSFLSNKISNEAHPYCISSLPEDNFLRFSIKELGDYTKTLNKLQVGDTAIIYGPYGHLGEKFEKVNGDSIFIAGGIGVAPFLSMFKKASLNKNNFLTTLFYCTKYKNEASFDSELQKLTQKNKNLKYCNQCSREPKGGKHLSIEQIKECMGDIKSTTIYLCGPTKMMLQVKHSLKTIGVSDENIILEDFEMI